MSIELRRINEKLKVESKLNSLFTKGELIKTNIGALFVTCFETKDGNLIFDTYNSELSRFYKPTMFRISINEKVMLDTSNYSKALLYVFLKLKSI